MEVYTGKRSGGRSRQKNFLKIPAAILGKVQSLPDDDVVVAGVVKISSTAIAAGEYQHLDMTLEDGRPTFPSEVVPKPTRGRYSRRNVEGKVLVRRDLPKVKPRCQLGRLDAEGGCVLKNPSAGCWRPSIDSSDGPERPEFGHLRGLSAMI